MLIRVSTRVPSIACNDGARRYNLCKLAPDILTALVHFRRLLGLDRRQRRTDSSREVLGIPSALRSLVDPGPPAQFSEGQRRAHPAGRVEISVDESVEKVA